MQRDELLLRRLHNQHLLSPGADPAGDLCGLQAQFLRNAVHALRIRTDAPDVSAMVKTWTLRGTVHLLPERDLPLYIRHCGGAEDVCLLERHGLAKCACLIGVEVVVAGVVQGDGEVFVEGADANAVGLSLFVVADADGLDGVVVFFHD